MDEHEERYRIADVPDGVYLRTGYILEEDIKR